jgi:DNA-binding transcriptional regulator GbsR (MarR family)
MSTTDDFLGAKNDFISQWGALGSSWGISRTMAQVHALLMISPDPISTDQCMEELQISRGNAHTNLKELVGWGLVKIVVKKGERKEFFEAEKDVWKIFTIVLRERKRREIDPALELLTGCAERSKNVKSVEGKAFHAQMIELEDFAVFASQVGETISKLKYGPAIKYANKFLGLLPKDKS